MDIKNNEVPPERRLWQTGNDELATQFRTDLESGLTEQEAGSRLEAGQHWGCHGNQGNRCGQGSR